MQEEKQQTINKKMGFSAMQVFAMIVGSMVLAIIATVFAIKFILFPGPFQPVTLSEKEEIQLEQKLAFFEDFSSNSTNKADIKTKDVTSSTTSKSNDLQPERYSEEGASRIINFTERELNSMVAKNTDLAEKCAIDLSKDMVSIKLLVPMDPDFPIMGGKTLKLKAGVELAYRESRPVVVIRGVSVMGVPMPNAWLGGLKNIDLVSEFGADEGFWKSFAAGIESINVVEGSLKIELKE